MAMEPIQGKCISSWVYLRYTNLFCISVVTSVFFSSCDSVLRDSLVFHQVNRGSLWFDWEHRIPLHAMQGNRASSCSEWEVLWDFSSCGRHLVYILDLRQGWPFENLVCSAKSGLLSSYDGFLRNLNYGGRTIPTLLEVRREAKHPLLVGTVILVYLSIFMKCQASSPFEALNLARLLRYQMDVRRPVQKIQRPRALSNVSSRDSYNTTLHLVRWKMSLHLSHCRELWPSLSQHILGSIPLEAENTESLSHTYCWRSLLLRCLWKFGLPLHLKTGNDSYPEMMSCTELSSSCCTETDDPQYLRIVSSLISWVS